MGRLKQPQIANELLERCTDYSLAHGLPERLDPLAGATGTSARMLLYHFGTRDALLQAILRQARKRQIASFTEWLRARSDEDYTETLARAWVEMTGPNGQTFVRMFNQLREDAEQTLWPDFKRIATTDWLKPLEEGLGTINRSESATLVLAVIRGLLMDREATGDTVRTDHAFYEFLRSLGPGAPQR